MKANDAELLESGFSHADIQKLKSNITNYGGTLDSAIHDLANRFNASRWITITAFIIFVFTLMLASADISITLAITLALILPFIWYLTPAKLAYKAWRFRKLTIKFEQHH